MSRPIRITLDMQALRHNLHRVRELAPVSAIMAMVKSNAYGHGLERIALALSDVEALGVACIEEALRLRQAGILKPIVLMEGVFSPEELQEVMTHQFQLIIHHEEQVQMLEGLASTLPLIIWLKVDTGMHRLGFQPEAVPLVYERLKRLSFVKHPVGLMTHFAESDNLIDKKRTENQIRLFQQLTQPFKGPRSLANSGGIIAWPPSHADWVRPGIMLYGASPFMDKRGEDHGLKPVMSFTSQIIATHRLKKGERVGYSGTWIADKESVIGVVACGYGDGYPRHAQNGTPLLVKGTVCPLAGRVSMDMLTVDLTGAPSAQVGDPVTLWGPDLAVEKVAAFCGTSAYELLTRITQRVPVYSRP